MNASILLLAAQLAICQAANSGDAAKNLVHEFKRQFETELLIQDRCFQADDHQEIDAWVAARCRDGATDPEAYASGLALVALKAGRCAGFERGYRAGQGMCSRQGERTFGVER